MRYREFGGTGIMVSEIGVGCGGLGMPPKVGLDPVLERAIDLGVNFFDTCDTYANTMSEQVLGRVLANHPRDRIVLCTKFGGRFDAQGAWYRDVSVPHLNEAFEASCRRLRTDYFDIYLVHTPPRDLCEHADLIAALDEMLAQGKIRAYGMSTENGDFASQLIRSSGARAIEITFHLFHQDARKAFLQGAREKGAGIICKSPMGGGMLAGSIVTDGVVPDRDGRHANWGAEKYARIAAMVRKVSPILAANGRTMGQGALAWLLGFPEVSTVIPGISSLARLEETAAAGDMRLTAAERAALDALDGGALVGRILS
jgi:aryl-alcohol dehydrogenase-like predicted oxidoreductase